MVLIPKKENTGATYKKKKKKNVREEEGENHNIGMYKQTGETYLKYKQSTSTTREVIIITDI